MRELAIKFVTWDIKPLSTLSESRAYKLRDLLNKGGKLTREDKNWITSEVNTNSYFKSAIPVMGWRFDFSDVLRRFWVSQYGRIAEYFAVDKAALREFLSGGIERIVEVK